MLISVSGKINSGKDLIGEIILYLTDIYYHSKVGEEANFENWRANKIHSSGYNISHKAMYEVNNTDHFKIKKWADKLKDIVCLLLNVDRETLEDREFKEKELGEEWTCYKVARLDRIINKCYLTEKEALTYIEYASKYYFKEGVDKLEQYRVIKVNMTPRLLLQLLGTECGREIIHPNIWVNALMSEYVKTYPPEEKGNMKVAVMPRKEYPNWIITDTRFPNELKAVKDRGGITIRVSKNIYLPGGGELGYIEHKSETALDNAEFDYTISNNGTIEELIDKVKEILIKEKII